MVHAPNVLAGAESVLGQSTPAARPEASLSLVDVFGKDVSLFRMDPVIVIRGLSPPQVRGHDQQQPHATCQQCSDKQTRIPHFLRAASAVRCWHSALRGDFGISAVAAGTKVISSDRVTPARGCIRMFGPGERA